MKIAAAAVIAALLLPAASGAVPARHVAQASAIKDWTAVTTIAPSGAFVLGNPAAKVKLIEYSSLTCPHCARFSADAMPSLRRDYIRLGKVSLEVRSAVRDRVDLAATLAARCGGPRRFFVTSEALFAAQDQWMTAATLAESITGPPSGDPSPDALLAVAQGAGLDAQLRPRGIVTSRACFADPAQKPVAAMTDDAWNRRVIKGTPFFLVNGVAVPGLTWPAVEAALRAAIG